MLSVVGYNLAVSSFIYFKPKMHFFFDKTSDHAFILLRFLSACQDYYRNPAICVYSLHITSVSNLCATSTTIHDKKNKKKSSVKSDKRKCNFVYP